MQRLLPRALASSGPQARLGQAERPEQVGELLQREGLVREPALELAHAGRGQALWHRAQHRVRPQQVADVLQAELLRMWLIYTHKISWYFGSTEIW